MISDVANNVSCHKNKSIGFMRRMMLGGVFNFNNKTFKFSSISVNHHIEVEDAG